jgi:V8-like Glu-specific endopeptidase
MKFRVFRVALIVALMLTCSFAMAQNPGPAKVGELELTDISTNGSYPIGINQWTVSHPDATYIRVHFSEFDLAAGDYISISNASGSYVRRFEGRGPHDLGHFWAATMPGDTAIITLNATYGGAAGFSIDSYGRGTEQVFDLEPNDPVGGPTPDSVCGTLDWRDAACYETSHPTEYEKSRAAVKALIGCCSSCTAFKISDSGQFMTNNHCTSSNSGVQSTELLLEFQNNACGGGGSGQSGSVMGSSLVATGYTYDYTLMTTTGNSGGIPCLELDDRLASVGERIYIAGHPSGNPKQLTIESTHSSNPSGNCEVDASPYSGRGSGSDVGYYCDTTGGSSGSPVIAASTGKVVALHHFGGCLNSGGRSDRIIQEIGSQIDVCTGGGGQTCTPGGGECDDGQFCNGVETCDGEFCQSGTNPCTTSQTCDEGADICVDPPVCAPKGDSCDTNSDCCNNKCRGKAGRRTCK